jgi:hypothetical protein
VPAVRGVKFLIDAQLPARPAELLNRARHDAVHTIGLPDENRSTDSQIAQRAGTDGRVVVTKDQEFRDGHLLGKSPQKLLVAPSPFSSIGETGFEPATARPPEGITAYDPVVKPGVYWGFMGPSGSEWVRVSLG